MNVQDGYCYYLLSPKYKYPVIYNLFVEKEFRGSGKAKRLLSLAIEEIRQYGYNDIICIEAELRENCMSKDDLIKFYESMGLEVINKDEVEHETD